MFRNKFFVLKEGGQFELLGFITHWLAVLG
jgi:hypothetical protein